MSLLLDNFELEMIGNNPFVLNHGIDDCQSDLSAESPMEGKTTNDAAPKSRLFFLVIDRISSELSVVLQEK
jgi:hypothetical protein